MARTRCAKSFHLGAAGLIILIANADFWVSERRPVAAGRRFFLRLFIVLPPPLHPVASAVGRACEAVERWWWDLRAV